MSCESALVSDLVKAGKSLHQYPMIGTIQTETLTETKTLKVETSC